MFPQTSSRLSTAARRLRGALLLLRALPVMFALLAGCRVPRFGQPDMTAYERYAHGLKSNGLDATALGRDWLHASDSALRTPFRATLPLREVGFYSRGEARAVAFRMALTEGQRVEARIEQQGQPTRLFVDLFIQPSDTIANFVQVEAATPTDTLSPASPLRIVYDVQRTGAYLLRIQPELLRDGKYQVQVTSGPQLAFPVQGQGNRAVQSYFGASREGGRREHHGVDIFAPRGTPALAAVEGTVRSIDPNELGGNVVWLSDVRRGQTLYYAHLDRHNVVAGQDVHIGDTLGFVGNTGNARTTRPHLHFGVYRRGYGPVDPYPYIRIVTSVPPSITRDTARLGAVAEVTAPRTTLHVAAARSADSLGAVPKATRVYLTGTQGTWLRVQLADGRSGYVNSRDIGPAVATTMTYGESGEPAGASRSGPAR